MTNRETWTWTIILEIIVSIRCFDVFRRSNTPNNRSFFIVILFFDQFSYLRFYILQFALQICYYFILSYISDSWLFRCHWHELFSLILKRIIVWIFQFVSFIVSCRMLSLFSLITRPYTSTCWKRQSFIKIFITFLLMLSVHNIVKYCYEKITD